MYPLISIIVPVYNVEDFIVQCIESIIVQTYKNIEVIIVDDGSTDRTGCICDEYAVKDSRIRVIHNKNMGVVIARKTGIEQAQGEYIGFVDGDDYIEPDMFEKLLKVIEEDSEIDFVHSLYIGYKGLRPYLQKEIIDLATGKQSFLCDAVLGENAYITPSMWSKLFKTAFLKKCFSEVSNSQGCGEDTVCLCAAILKASKIALTDEAFYHYRIRQGSLSHYGKGEGLNVAYLVYNGICDVLKKNNCYEELKDTMDKYLYRRALLALKNIDSYEFQFAYYRFPHSKELFHKKIIIYGAGNVGKDYYSQFCRYSECTVVAWVDKNYSKYDFFGITVSPIEKIITEEYDYVVIAIKNKEAAEEIIEELLEKSIPKEKIIWKEPETMNLV